MRKPDDYKKLDNLRNFILGWVHEEAGSKDGHPALGSALPHSYNSRREKLMIIASPDLEYINKIIRNPLQEELTRTEMKKCNALKKKYSAISNVEFGET